MKHSRVVSHPVSPAVPATPIRHATRKMMARYWKAIEARTLGALREKVAAARAAGWICDGEAVEVTRYGRHHRSSHRVCQCMLMHPTSFA